MNTLSRRRFLKAAGLGVTASLLAACQPKVVEKIVKETVEVEKEVEKIVKETVIVEGEAKVVEKVVTTTPAAEAPMEILTWRWVPGTAGSAAIPVPDDDCMVKTDIEKALNIKLNIWWLERATYVEQLSTRAAGGEVVDYPAAASNAFYDQGLVGKITLTDFAIHCPRFFQEEAEFDNGSLECFYGGLYNGVRYTYGYYSINNLFPFTIGWRKDALDKAGLGVPTTLDEMEAALKKFVDDGLFEYAVRYRCGDFMSHVGAEVSAAYGAISMLWTEDDQGGIVSGYMHPAHQKSMQKLQEWYKAGLIHPESATTKNTEYGASFCQGEFGVATHATWYRLLPGGEYYECITPQGWELALGPAPKGPEGHYGYPSWGKGNGGETIGSHVDRDPAKKAKILELIELVNADYEWATYVRYGKEEHRYRDETGALYMKPTDQLGIDPKKLGAGSIWSGYGATPSICFDWLGEDFPQIFENSGQGTLKYLADIGKIADMTPCKDYTELGAINDRWRLDFLTGAKDPVKDWDQYVNEYMAAGGECQLEQMKLAMINKQALDKAIRSEVEGLLQNM